MFVSLETAKLRYQNCKECENFQPLIKTCGLCNCFMPGKVILGMSTCPADKWQATTADHSNINYTIKDYE